eukprot:TRINITY_DN1802_c0_g1_i2.p1 TRINITY_DN1802_c0_g1~~TRINITY_DN1802_c0_g1_i2.p1  ORF type:complete len:328 (-),score=101.29 TRINITY_DN1802_c0_g1_i2:62-1045(-)
MPSRRTSKPSWVTNIFLSVSSLFSNKPLLFKNRLPCFSPSKPLYCVHREDGKYRIDCLQFIHVVILKCDLIGEEMSDRLRKIQETSQIIHKCEKLECGFEVADPFVHSRCQRNENGDFLCRKCGGKLVKMGISPEYAQAIERNAMLQERLHVIHESLKQLSEFYVELEKSDVKEGFITRKEYRSRTNQLDMKTKEGISLRVVVEVNCDPLPPRRRSKGRGVKKEPEVDKEESEECGQMDADDAMAEEPLDGNGGGDGPKDDAFMLVEEDAELSSGSFDENEFWNPFEKKERPEEDPMEEEEEGGEKDVKKGNSDGLFPTIKKEQEEQ